MVVNIIYQSCQSFDVNDLQTSEMSTNFDKSASQGHDHNRGNLIVSDSGNIYSSSEYTAPPDPGMVDNVTYQSCDFNDHFDSETSTTADSFASRVDPCTHGNRIHFNAGETSCSSNTDDLRADQDSGMVDNVLHQSFNVTDFNRPETVNNNADSSESKDTRRHENDSNYHDTGYASPCDGHLAPTSDNEMVDNILYQEL